MLAGITGISKDILLGNAPAGGDDPEQAATEPNLAKTGDSLGKATKNLAVAGETVADRTKRMEKGAQGFMKSSPGAWVILSKAGTEISKRVMMLTTHSFKFVGKLVGAMSWIAMKGIKTVLGFLSSGITNTLKSVISLVVKTIRHSIVGPMKSIGGIFWSISYNLEELFRGPLRTVRKAVPLIAKAATFLASTVYYAMVTPARMLRRAFRTLGSLASKLLEDPIEFVSAAIPSLLRRTKEVVKTLALSILKPVHALKDAFVSTANAITSLIGMPGRIIRSAIPSIIKHTKTFVGSIISFLALSTGIVNSAIKLFLKPEAKTKSAQSDLIRRNYLVNYRSERHLNRILDLLRGELQPGGEEMGRTLTGPARASRMRDQMNVQDSLGENMGKSVQIQEGILKELQDGEITTLLREQRDVLLEMQAKGPGAGFLFNNNQGGGADHQISSSRLDRVRGRENYNA